MPSEVARERSGVPAALALGYAHRRPGGLQGGPSAALILFRRIPIADAATIFLHRCARGRPTRRSSNASKKNNMPLSLILLFAANDNGQSSRSVELSAHLGYTVSASRLVVTRFGLLADDIAPSKREGFAG